MTSSALLSVLMMATTVTQPVSAPQTRVDSEQAVKIALAHLNIDKVTKEPGEAFNLRVSHFALSPKRTKELDDRRNGITKHIDIAGLPPSFEVFQIKVQHGLSGDSSVYVTQEGGRVILVKFTPEG